MHFMLRLTKSNWSAQEQTGPAWVFQQEQDGKRDSVAVNSKRKKKKNRTETLLWVIKSNAGVWRHYQLVKYWQCSDVIAVGEGEGEKVTTWVAVVNPGDRS